VHDIPVFHFIVFAFNVEFTCIFYGLFGARPLKEILNEPSKITLAGKVSSENEIMIDYREDDGFTFENR